MILLLGSARGRGRVLLRKTEKKKRTAAQTPEFARAHLQNMLQTTLAAAPRGARAGGKSFPEASGRCDTFQCTPRDSRRAGKNGSAKMAW